MTFLYKIRLKMDQKIHIIKGLKKEKHRFFGIELGGTTLPPLTKNHSAQKLLAELGGTPSPFNEKNPLSSILRLPAKNMYFLCESQLE